MVRLILWTMAALWVIIFTTYLLGTAFAHQAPTGWSYDSSCCNTTDCRQVLGPDDPRDPTKVRIRETRLGYVIEKVGAEEELIEFGSKKIRESKDGFYHWCSHGGRDDTGSLCLYIPFRAY